MSESDLLPGGGAAEDAAELHDRVAIQHLISSFVFWADRGRATEVASLFADDGTLEWVGVGQVVGRDEIEAWIEAAKRAFLASPTPSVRHHCSSVHITLEDEHHATASSYWLAVTAEGGQDHWGRYDDVLVRRDSRWQFHHRRVKVDGQVAGSVSVHFAEVVRAREASAPPPGGGPPAAS